MIFAGASAAPSKFRFAWHGTLTNGSKGYGAILFGKSEQDRKVSDWVEPNISGTLGIGVDSSNPLSSNIFNADGNIYGRRETEISLHWNGKEIANRFCWVDFRDPLGCDFAIEVQFVTGGAEITLTVDGAAIYDGYFVPEVMPFEPKIVLGGEAEITRLVSTQSGKAVVSKVPTSIVVFDKVLNDAGHHRQSADIQFPEKWDGIGRVVLTLNLSDTPAGLDPWDRIAAIYLYDEKGERFEILRYITPYKKGWEWKVDVTDFMPLLVGKKKLEMWCETWGAGWLVSVKLDFYKGKAERIPIKVINVWNCVAEIGYEGSPFAKSVPPKSINVGKEAQFAKMRLCVTGHGQAPNSDNAAEFCSLWRVLKVNGEDFKNTLWKQDCYLNPCRPQGGTWKFDRAGWAPGDVVATWQVDLSKSIIKNRTLSLEYQIQPFENKTRDAGNPARHFIESQLILYRK